MTAMYKQRIHTKLPPRWIRLRTVFHDGSVETTVVNLDHVVQIEYGPSGWKLTLVNPPGTVKLFDEEVDQILSLLTDTGQLLDVRMDGAT